MKKCGTSIGISIIIPTCDYEKAWKTVECLLAQDYHGLKYEILFIYDNLRKPMPLEWRWKIRAKGSKGLKLIINKENLGLAGNYNLGIEMAKYENLVTIHEDMETKDRDFIFKLVKKLDGEQVVNALVKVPDKVFNDYDFWNKMMLFRHAGVITPAIGKTTAYRRSVFHRVGYWDNQTFRTAGEDMDMNIRLRQANIYPGLLKEIIWHVHEPKAATFFTLLKKEWQMGDAHGAFKRKYPWHRAGFFGMVPRLACLLLGMLGLFAHPLFFLFLLPFLLIPMYQAVKAYANCGWLIGLLLYPIIGMIIMFTHTIAASKAYIKGRQTI